MKYVRQFAIILCVSFIGEICHIFLPFPIPASIYGLVLMLLALQLGVIQPHHVQDVGKFLIEIMPLMFIPAAVGLMDVWPTLQPVCVPFLLIMLLSTIIVMAVTGWVTQGILHWGNHQKETPENSAKEGNNHE